MSCVQAQNPRDFPWMSTACYRKACNSWQPPTKTESESLLRYSWIHSLQFAVGAAVVQSVVVAVVVAAAAAVGVAVDDAMRRCSLLM